MKVGRSGTSLVNFINLCKSLDKTPNDILRDFFSSNQVNNDNLVQQISILDDYEKDALYTLIQYFNIKYRDNNIKIIVITIFIYLSLKYTFSF